LKERRVPLNSFVVGKTRRQDIHPPDLGRVLRWSPDGKMPQTTGDKPLLNLGKADQRRSTRLLFQLLGDAL
jgi:hypothetical protein